MQSTAGRDDDIVSVPFSRECAEEKEKEEREQCNMVHTLLN
jgi:hypothetical protein